MSSSGLLTGAAVLTLPAVAVEILLLFFSILCVEKDPARGIRLRQYWLMSKGLCAFIDILPLNLFDELSLQLMHRADTDKRRPTCLRLSGGVTVISGALPSCMGSNLLLKTALLFKVMVIGIQS